VISSEMVIWEATSICALYILIIDYCCSCFVRIEGNVATGHFFMELAVGH